MKKKARLSPGGNDRVFDTEHVRRDLRRRSVQGALATMLSQIVLFGVQLSGTLGLAHLLTPADFGVFGKTIALTGFIMMFRTGGLMLATVQRAEITEAQVSNLFWVNFGVGVLAAGALAALSPLLAWFYKDPRVLPLSVTLAGAIIIDSLCVQQTALMQRQMRFTALGIANILSRVGGFLAAFYSAWRGDGFWALAVQQYAVAITMLLLVISQCRWLPSLPRRGTGVWPMVRFGMHQTGTNILTFASRNADNILIGRYVSDVALGFYTQAYRLLLLPVQQVSAPITSVVVPALSRLQNEPERFVRFFHQAIGTIGFLGMPVVCFLLVDATPVIMLALGQNWLPIVPMFEALGVAAFLGIVDVASGWVYTSLGRSELQLRWQIVSTLVTLVAFLVGLRWGAIGVAASFSISRILLIGPSLWVSSRGTPVRPRATLKVLARPATASAVASIGLVAFHSTRSQWPVAWIIADALLYTILYVAVWPLIPGGREHLRQILSLVRELKLRRTTV